jgi:hypothetical protein
MVTLELPYKEACGNVNSNGAVCDLKDFHIVCVPRGRIHGRTCGWKGSLLKVRGGKLQKGAWWDQVEAGSRERVFFSLQVLLKPTLIHGKGRTWRFLINNQ